MARLDNTRRLPDAGLMLPQRLRRWPSIKPTLEERYALRNITYIITSYKYYVHVIIQVNK